MNVRVHNFYHNYANTIYYYLNFFFETVQRIHHTKMGDDLRFNIKHFNKSKPAYI